MRILYIQTAFLGDLLLAIPSLKCLRQKYPDSEIHLICRKGLGSFMTATGLVDMAFEGRNKTKPSYAEASFFLANYNYDLVLCPHESLRSAVITYKAKSPLKIGFRHWWNRWGFTKRCPRPMHLPEALRQLSLVAEQDLELQKRIRDLNSKSLPMETVPEWSSMVVESLADPTEDKKKEICSKWGLGSSSFVVIAPGSVWPTKRWTGYKELAQLLIEQGHSVVCVGAPSEQKDNQELFHNNSEVIDLTGKTNIYELAEVLSLAQHVVANDSGTMHMASVVGVNCTALFGPTVQSFGYQPWNEKATVKEVSDLKCRPCSIHGTKSCPIGTHECMTRILPADVAKTI